MHHECKLDKSWACRYDLYVTTYYVECIVMMSTGSIYWLTNPDIQGLAIFQGHLGQVF